MTNADQPVSSNVRYGQCAAVLLSTGATLIFVLVLSAIFGSVHAPLIAPYFKTLEVLILLILLTLLSLPYILDGVVRSLAGSKGLQPGRFPAAIFGRFRGERRISVALWFGAAAQFLVLGYLTMRTGGVDKSPYAAVLLAYFTLAPAIMEGLGSLVFLLLAALAYVAALGFFEPFRFPVGKGVEYSSETYVWVDLGTVFIALGIALIKRYLSEESPRPSRSLVWRWLRRFRSRADAIDPKVPSDTEPPCQ